MGNRHFVGTLRASLFGRHREVLNCFSRRCGDACLPQVMREVDGVVLQRVGVNALDGVGDLEVEPLKPGGRDFAYHRLADQLMGKLKARLAASHRRGQQTRFFRLLDTVQE